MARVRLVLRGLQQSTAPQQRALSDIFLGRAGGTVLRNFAAAISEVYAVRPARIELDHRPGRWFMRASDYLSVRASVLVPSDLSVSCGIPGHDHPGEAVVAEMMRVDDPPLGWDVHARCGFTSTFDYCSDLVC